MPINLLLTFISVVVIQTGCYSNEHKLHTESMYQNCTERFNQLNDNWKITVDAYIRAGESYNGGKMQQAYLSLQEHLEEVRRTDAMIADFHISCRSHFADGKVDWKGIEAFNDDYMDFLHKLEKACEKGMQI